MKRKALLGLVSASMLTIIGGVSLTLRTMKI